MRKFRKSLVQPKLVMFLSAAAAVASALAASPAVAGSGHAPVAARHPSVIPDGMTALTYHRMINQIPLDRAAEQVRRAAAQSRAGRDGLVQIAVNDDTSTLTIYWHGSVPPSVQRVLAGARSTMHVLVKPARYSQAQLNRAVRVVLRSGRRIELVGPLTDGSGIRIGVPGTAPDLSPSVAQRYFNSPVPVRLVSQAPIRAAGCVPNSSDTLNAGSRCYDLAAFWGGAVVTIRNDSSVLGFCTTGFGVHFSNGSTGMLTAGHCLKGTGQSNSSWWNGHNSTELGSSYESPFTASSDPSGASHDVGVIKTAAGSGTHYYDGPSIFKGDTYNTKIVVGQAGANIGDWYCESGAFSGVLCNMKVVGTNEVAGFYVDNRYLFYDSGIVQTTGANNSQPTDGDSGGPVFSLAGTGTVTARGICNGRDATYVYFTPMNLISSDLGVSVNTG